MTNILSKLIPIYSQEFFCQNRMTDQMFSSMFARRGLDQAHQAYWRFRWHYECYIPK